MKQTWKVGIVILTCPMVTGCQSESQRLADMADQTVRMQASQNSQIAKTHEQIIQLNRDVQEERNELNRQNAELESGRRALNRLRRSELAWAESFRLLSIVIAAGMPLFLCAYLIWAASRQTSCHEAVNEILVRELVSFRPRLITAPNLPAIEHNSDTSDAESNNSRGN